MSCTNPVIAQSFVCPITGEKGLRFRNFQGEPDLKLACRKCPSCKLQYAQEWALRCWHESQMHDESAFVTLTYRDEDLPKNQALDHRDFQLFMKRLRNKYPKRKISYYMCGEYGDRTHRPHYHALIFGYYPPDAVYHRSDNGNRYYKSEELDALWQKGFTDTSQVNYKSAGYVARYQLKKQLPNEPFQDRYIYIDENGNQQTRPFEYVRMSKRPAIGETWAMKYCTHWATLGYCNTPECKPAPVPKYYLKMLKEELPEIYEALLVKRLESINDEDNTPDRLRQKAICVDAKLKQKIRPYL